MFGGATRYVETLDAILEFVATHQPTTDEFVGWVIGPRNIAPVGEPGGEEEPR